MSELKELFFATEAVRIDLVSSSDIEGIADFDDKVNFVMKAHSFGSEDCLDVELSEDGKTLSYFFSVQSVMMAEREYRGYKMDAHESVYLSELDKEEPYEINKVSHSSGSINYFIKYMIVKETITENLD